MYIILFFTDEIKNNSPVHALKFIYLFSYLGRDLIFKYQKILISSAFLASCYEIQIQEVKYK